ncbi:MAG: hypothetical protein E6J58_17100 [Deltaproteobacteria bacterium]|nr:MAG: hypothetical protein E6J58_17100 [Deltaproteobacteria bacterium]
MQGICLLLLALSCAHRPVASSAYAVARAEPSSAGNVRISATRDPPGAEELGIVEAHGSATLEAVLSAFRQRVAGMGGDYGRLDVVATKNAVVQESRSYECGSNQTHDETRFVTRANPDGTFSTDTETVSVTTYVSQTCRETRDVEVVTLSVVGRAFRTAREGR